MYRGVVPFILLQLAGLAIVGVFPPLVNYLPNTVYLSSETAPPPKNPKLQLCLEEYVFKVYDLTGDELRASIGKARALDLGALPENLRSAVAESLDSAQATFEMVDKVRGAETALAEYLVDYRPLHLQVRAMEPEIYRLKDEIQDLEKRLGRLERGGEADDEELRELERRIELLKLDKAERESAIPAEWEAARKGYVALADAEKKDRRAYRRNVDEAYEPIQELRKLIAQAEALAALRAGLEGLSAVVAGDPAEQAIETIKSFEKELRAVDGVSPITSKLSRTRRALKGDSPDREQAAAELAQALEAYTSEVAWRRRAQTELAAPLEDYDKAIRGSIGARSQERLNSDQASDVAACLSIHRDISLSF